MWPVVTRMSLLYFPQITDATVAIADGTSMKTALEDLENIDDIDGVDVTLTTAFTFSGLDPSTLVLQYQITFTGECVRGYIPDTALRASTCTESSTTTIIDYDVVCR